MGDSEDKRPEWGKKLSKYIPIPQRFILAIMGFLSIINNYTLRNSINVSITRLVPLRNYTEAGAKDVCPAELDSSGHTVEKEAGGTHEWSQTLQGVIIGAFYVGYVIGHIPAGRLAEKYGAKWVLVGGMASMTLLAFITPVVIENFHPYVLVGLRCVMGVGAAVAYPSNSALIAQWVPVHERSCLGAFTLGGGQMGTVVSNTMSGALLKYTTWPWVFYTFGMMATLWIFFFIIMCYSDPESHPYLSDKERDYIMLHMGRLGRNHNLPPFPWGSVFKSKAVLSLISAQIGHDWGFYVMLTYFPKFLNDVLQLKIMKTGFYSSIPFLVFWITSLIFGAIANYIIKKDIKYASTVRKVMTFIGATPCGALMVIGVYIGCKTSIIISCFTVSMGLMGAYYAGIKLSPNDLAPNYAGTLMAIVNGIGSITGMLAPLTSGMLTGDTTMKQWREVFWLALVVLTIPTIPFLVWGSAEVQDFNEPNKKE